MTESKKKRKEPVVDKTQQSVSQLILDCSKEKYRLVSIIARWAYEVKVRDQSVLPPQKLVNKALKEVLSGQVDIEAVEKLPPLPKPDKKTTDSPVKSAAEKALNLTPGPDANGSKKKG